MRASIGLMTIIVGVYGLVPAAAAPVAASSAKAAPKCSFKMKELSGDLLVLQDDGRYCEADSAARKAKEQSLAAYYKDLFPEETLAASFLPTGKPTPNGRSTKGVSAYGGSSSGSSATLIKATYDYCLRHSGMGAAYCNAQAPAVANQAMSQVYARCATDGVDRETCDLAITMAAQQLNAR